MEWVTDWTTAVRGSGPDRFGARSRGLRDQLIVIPIDRAGEHGSIFELQLRQAVFFVHRLGRIEDVIQQILGFESGRH